MNKNAIIIGVVGYISLYFTHYIFINYVANVPLLTNWEIIVNYILSTSIWLIPSYFAGRIAGRNGLVHGITIGLLGMLLVFIVFRLITEEASEMIRDLSVVMSLIQTLIFCSLAAGVGELHAKNASQKVEL